MNDQNLIPSGVVISCIVGFLAGIAITNTGVGDDTGLLIFLSFCVLSALFLNDSVDKHYKFTFWWVLPPPTVSVAVVLYRLTFHNVAWFSGTEFAWTVLDIVNIAVFWLSGVVGTLLCFYGASKILQYVRYLFRLSKTERNKTLHTLEWVLKLIGLYFLIVKACFEGWILN